MDRRGFLGSLLALGAAPAIAPAIAPSIVRADSLMRIVARDTNVLVPVYFDYAPVGDALAVSVFIKGQNGVWQNIRQHVLPGQRPFVMVPVPRSMGVAELYAPQVEKGDTMRIALP